MANLRPFRDYDEKDVINMFALDTAAAIADGGFANLLTSYDGRVTKGTLVGWKAGDAGWHSDVEPVDLMEAAGGLDPQNVTSQRYGALNKVRVVDAAEEVLGMLLNDVAVVDENGEQLKFNPRKASELEAVIPGQAVPVVTRGIFLIESAALSAESFEAGARLVVLSAGNGEFSTVSVATTDTSLGRTLGNNVAGSPNAGDLHLIALDVSASAAA